MARLELEQRYSLCSLSYCQTNEINITEEYWHRVLSSRKNSTSPYQPKLNSPLTNKQINNEEITTINNTISEKARELRGINELQSFFDTFSDDSEIITLINNKDIMERTALHEVCELNIESNLLLLLQYGGDPNLTDWRNQTPLHYAIQRGHFNLVKILVYFMHKKSFELIDSSGKNILLLALAYSHLDIALFLLQFIGIHLPHIHLSQFIHREDNEGNSAARLLKLSNYFDVFDRVWKDDESTQIQQVNSLLTAHPTLWNTVLHSSSILSPFWLTNFNIFPKIKSPSSDQFDHHILLLLQRLKRDFKNENIFVQFLLQQDLLSITPLHYIIKRGSVNLLQYFLTVGASYKSNSFPEFSNIIPLFFILLDYSKRSILHYCAQTGNEELLTLLLNHLQCHTHPDLFKKIINFPDINGNSPLLIAAQYHHWDLVQVFLQYSAVHKLSNDDQHTLYSLFVEFDQREKFRRYIDLFPDCDLSFALFIACKNGNFELFHSILSKKSHEENQKMLNNVYVYHSLLHPKFPIEIAMENSHYSMVIYILEEYYSESSLPSLHSSLDNCNENCNQPIQSGDPLRTRLFNSFRRIQTITTKDQLEELLVICKYNEHIPLNDEENFSVYQLIRKIIQSPFYETLESQKKTPLIVQFFSLLSTDLLIGIENDIIDAILSLDINDIHPQLPLFDYLRLHCKLYYGTPEISDIAQWNIYRYKRKGMETKSEIITKYTKLMGILINSSAIQTPPFSTQSFSQLLSQSSNANTPFFQITKMDLMQLSKHGLWEICYIVLRDVFHNDFAAFSSAFPLYHGFYYAIKYYDVGFIYLYCKEFLSENYQFSDSDIQLKEKRSRTNYRYFRDLFGLFHSHIPENEKSSQENHYFEDCDTDGYANVYLELNQYFMDKNDPRKNMNAVHQQMKDLKMEKDYHRMNKKKSMVMLRLLKFARRRGNPLTVFTLLLFSSQINSSLIVESPFTLNSTFLFNAFHYSLPIHSLRDYQMQLIKLSEKNGEENTVQSYLQAIQSPLIVNHLIHHWRNYLDRVHPASPNFLNYFTCLTDDFDLCLFGSQRNRSHYLNNQHNIKNDKKNHDPNLSFTVLKLIVSHTQEKVNVSNGFFMIMNQYYLSTPNSGEYNYLFEKIQYLLKYLSNQSIYLGNDRIDLHNPNQIPNMFIQSLYIAAKKGDKKLLEMMIRFIKSEYQHVDWKRILTYRISEYVNYKLSYVNLFYYLLYYRFDNLEKDSHLLLDYIVNEMRNSNNQTTIRPCDLYTINCTDNYRSPYIELYSQSDTKAMWIAAAQSHYSLLSFAIDQSPSYSSDRSSTIEQLNSSATFIIDDYMHDDYIPQSQLNNNINKKNEGKVMKERSNYDLEEIYKLLKEMGCKSKQIEIDAKIAAKKGYWNIAFDLLHNSTLNSQSDHYFISFIQFAIEQENHVILTKLLFDCIFSHRYSKDLLYSIQRMYLLTLAMNYSLFNIFLTHQKFDLTPLMFISIFLTNHKRNFPHSLNPFEYLFLNHSNLNINDSYSFTNNYDRIDRRNLTRLVDKQGNTILHQIAKCGNLAIFKAIESFLEPSCYYAQNLQLYRPIETACRYGNTEIALHLIDHYSIQRDFPDYRDKEGDNILHHIFYSGKKKILRKFHEIFYSALYYSQLSNFVGETNLSMYNCLSYGYAMGHSHLLSYFSSLYANQNFDVIMYGKFFDLYSFLSDYRQLKGFFSSYLKLNQSPPPLQYHPPSLFIDDYLCDDYFNEKVNNQRINTPTKKCEGTKFLFEYTHTKCRDVEDETYWKEIEDYRRVTSYSHNPFDFVTAVATNNLNLLKTYRKFGFMLNGPVYFIQACTVLGKLSILQYAYSQKWFTISDLYYNLCDHPLRSAYIERFRYDRTTYSPSFGEGYEDCPLFLSLKVKQREIYSYFKELLVKESKLYHPSSIKELRDVEDNYLVYWLIRNDWKEEYEEVLSHYHLSDPLDLQRLRLSSKSKENIYHIVYGTRNHPLQSHCLFQLHLLFPHCLPLFSDCFIFLSLLNNVQMSYDVMISTFNINYNHNEELAKKMKQYLIQFIDFLFEVLPLSFIHRSFYSLVNNIEPITSMRFYKNRNILHLILLNPTQYNNLRYKHYRYFHESNPELLLQKDSSNCTPISYLSFQMTRIYWDMLKHHFVDVLSSLDIKNMFEKYKYYSIFKNHLVVRIIKAITYFEQNKVGNKEIFSMNKFRVPPVYAKQLSNLNTSDASSIVKLYSNILKSIDY